MLDGWNEDTIRENVLMIIIPKNYSLKIFLKVFIFYHTEIWMMFLYDFLSVILQDDNGKE